LREILTAQKLHHEVRLPAVGAEVGHVDDVGVTNAVGEVGFTQKPRSGLGHGREKRAQNLDRDALSNLPVYGLVHRAHRSFTDESDDLVFAESSTRYERCAASPVRPLPCFVKAILRCSVHGFPRCSGYLAERNRWRRKFVIIIN
jgi:hypothetical protein